MRAKTTMTLLLFLALSVFCKAQDSETAERPLNVIILIGDGMGLSHLSIPYYYDKDEPVFSSFSYVGILGTSSASHSITESAAAATAMFTGHKTYNSAIGVDKDTVEQKNLVEVVSQLGYQTGVIATSAITHATPAGFYAHEVSRDYYYDIAIDLLESDIDFFAGGGLKYFIDPEGRDLFSLNNLEVEFTKLKKIRKPEEGKRYGFLLAQDRMPAMIEKRGNFLPKATEIASDFLSREDQGFLLMVEGSQIDWASHSNSPEYLISEMADFEQAVKVAYDFAVKDGNTLVIVTADHETGGFTLSASGEEKYGSDYGVIDPKFATTTHSAALVPLLAFGPGAENFAGIYENTSIFYKIIDLIGGLDQ